MSAAPQTVPFRAVQITTREADELRALLADLEGLALLAPQVVRDDVRALVRSLQERRKVCHGCATEVIGRRRPKLSQRVFCSEGCSQAARDADFRERKRRALQGPHG